MNDFEILEQIGRGAHGIVYLVQSKLNNQVYVIKKIKFENFPTKNHKNHKDQAEKYKKVLIEVHNMRQVEHQNIIKYYNSFFDETAVYILMEYASGGDLHQVTALTPHEINLPQMIKK